LPRQSGNCPSIFLARVGQGRFCAPNFSEGDYGSMNLGTMGTSGFTVWLTGMSGAGKSTLAQGLANRLRRLGKVVDVLDGPELEQMLGIGGGIIIQSAIESPYREARDEARRQISRFAEVFVECPTETLIQRDKSGKYKRALAGDLKTLPGITEPYEPPSHAEVMVDTSKHSVDEAVEHILGQLVAQRLLDPAVAAMKGRPKVQARAPAPAPKPKPEKKVLKLPERKVPRPEKAKRAAPARKQTAARTARADRPRMAAGGKRKR